MKKLMIISFLALGACSIAIDAPIDGPNDLFPADWRGYYTFVSGEDHLPTKFKVSDKYMSYKRSSHSSDSDDFYTYQIEEVNTSSATEFSFNPENAYGDSDWGLTSVWYEFETTGTANQITVKKIEILLLFPITYTATYTKAPL
jgi:hypothetical protein